MPLLAALPQHRQWVRVGSDGKSVPCRVDRNKLVSELSVPFRDLRIVDPLAPGMHITALLIRARALIVALPSTRMIITHDCAYVLAVPAEDNGNKPVPVTIECQFIRSLAARLQDAGEAHARELPFELKVLEAALSATTQGLDHRTSQLKHKVYTGLQAMSSKVDVSDLKLLRECKEVLKQQLASVTTFTQALEGILGDDDDMHNMYLGHREEAAAVSSLQDIANAMQKQTLMSQASLSSYLATQGAFESQSDKCDRSLGQSNKGTTVHVSVDTTPVSAVQDSKIMHQQAVPHVLGFVDVAKRRLERQLFRQQSLVSRYHEAQSQVPDLLRQVEEVQHAGQGLRNFEHCGIDDCEAMLQTYYIQAVSVAEQLEQLQSYIGATESLVAINLDTRRNELVALNLVVASLTLSVAFVAMVAGIFGQNLHFSTTETPLVVFLSVTISSIVSGAAIFMCLMLHAKRHQLLFIPHAAKEE